MPNGEVVREALVASCATEKGSGQRNVAGGNHSRITLQLRTAKETYRTYEGPAM